MSAFTVKTLCYLFSQETIASHQAGDCDTLKTIQRGNITKE